MSRAYPDKAKNDRRFELIVKEMDSQLTPEEAVELEELQEWIDKWLDEHCPLTFHPRIQAMLDEMGAKGE